MWSNPIVSAEIEVLETTPLLESERSSRHNGDPQPQKRTLSIQGPAARTLSQDLPCISSQQHRPLLSRSEPTHNVRQWVELRLENSGSVARDHLASERTFLAYMRTSLAIASSGVALTQLFDAASSHASSHKLGVYIRPLGASTVIVGLLVLFIGITRYFTVQVALTKGVFPVARLATGFVAMMMGVLVTLTFGILLAGK